MNYYLAKIKIRNLIFTRLVKAKNIDDALEVAYREYPEEYGYSINIHVTLE